jgi:hypothetical protein
MIEVACPGPLRVFDLWWAKQLQVLRQRDLPSERDTYVGAMSSARLK